MMLSMRRRWAMVATVTVAAFGWAAAAAPAAVSYSYLTDTPAVNPNPGTTFMVQLFLQETVTTPSVSGLVAENGLYGAGLSITRTGTVPASPSVLTGIAPNRTATGFPGGGFSAPTNTATLIRATENEDTENLTIPGAQPVDLGGGVRRVFLFTLSLQAGTVPGQTTTYAIERYQPPFNGFTVTHNNSYDIDIANDGFAHSGATGTTFTVTTAVPEPGAMGMVGTVVAGLLLRRRRANAATR
jgi:hypothetical protein